MRSRVLDKVVRRQQILAKQLKRTAAIVAQISCSQALREEGWDECQQLVKRHTVQAFKAKDQVRLCHDPARPSVLPEVVAQNVFDDLPRWDSDTSRAEQALYKAVRAPTSAYT